MNYKDIVKKLVEAGLPDLAQEIVQAAKAEAATKVTAAEYKNLTAAYQAGRKKAEDWDDLPEDKRKKEIAKAIKDMEQAYKAAADFSKATLQNSGTFDYKKTTKLVRSADQAHAMYNNQLQDLWWYIGALAEADYQDSKLAGSTVATSKLHD